MVLEDEFDYWVKRQTDTYFTGGIRILHANSFDLGVCLIIALKSAVDGNGGGYGLCEMTTSVTASWNSMMETATSLDATQTHFHWYVIKINYIKSNI